MVPLIPEIKNFLFRRAKNPYYFSLAKGRYVTQVLSPFSTAVIDPFKLLPVNPRQIQYVTGTADTVDWTPSNMHKDRNSPIGSFSIRPRIGTIVGGSWDQSEVEFTELCVYRSFEAHFEKEVPWDQTEYFERECEIIETNGSAYGCSSKSEFLEKRCGYLDNLYESIAKEGYKSQAEVSDPRSKSIFHEITVNIGRDGQLLYNRSGQHRLAIARLLGIDSVPVLPVVRHPQWQAIREQVFETGDCPNHIDSTHPDLSSF